MSWGAFGGGDNLHYYTRQPPAFAILYMYCTGGTEMPQSHTWQPLCVYHCGNRLERVTKAEKSLGVRLAIHIYHTSNSCECNGVNGEPLQLRVFFSLHKTGISLFNM